MKPITIENVTFGATVTYLIVIIALAIGWIMNIIEIVTTLSGPITGMLIARLVGTIVFPLGGVLGYF